MLLSIARRCSISCPCTSCFFSSPRLFLSAAVRWGWRNVLAASELVWLLAQFGLRDYVHNWIVPHHPPPDPPAGNRSLQPFRVADGLDRRPVAGASSAQSRSPQKIPALARRRSRRGPPLLRWSPLSARSAELTHRHSRCCSTSGRSARSASSISLRSDRLLLAAQIRDQGVVHASRFLTLGKASLQVFCAHLFSSSAASRCSTGKSNNFTGFTATLLLAVTFISLTWVAAHEVRKRQLKRKKPQNPPAPRPNNASTQRPNSCLRSCAKTDFLWPAPQHRMRRIARVHVNLHRRALVGIRPRLSLAFIVERFIVVTRLQIGIVLDVRENAT